MLMANSPVTMAKTPDIYHLPVTRGLALAWVNSYSAVVVKTPGATLMFDPVSLEVPDDVTLDLIAVSHDHSDHWDPRLVEELRRRTQATVVTSTFMASRLNQTPLSANEIPPLALYESENFAQQENRKELHSGLVKPLQPGYSLEVGDVTLTALRCDHAARQPLSFLVRTADNLTVYLPGDSTPFPEMADLAAQLTHPEGGGPRVRVDILIWMGTALTDGAEIARLVRPKVLVTYAIAPPQAGVRARKILRQLTPQLEFHALERHQAFLYPP